MKFTVVNLRNETVGEVELEDSIFGLPARTDILHRVVTWQLAKRRAGTHKTKGISEISGTTAKPYRQKGTGRARQGSRRSPQFRGGATIFGPVVRSHEYDLPKKVRKLGLRTALSVKAAEGKLVILDEAKADTHKTKAIAESLAKLGLGSVLFVDAERDTNFERAIANIPYVDLLPQEGANVYDILRRDTLVLTQAAAAKLVERLR